MLLYSEATLPLNMTREKASCELGCLHRCDKG